MHEQVRCLWKLPCLNTVGRTDISLLTNDVLCMHVRTMPEVEGKRSHSCSSSLKDHFNSCLHLQAIWINMFYPLREGLDFTKEMTMGRKETTPLAS